MVILITLLASLKVNSHVLNKITILNFGINTNSCHAEHDALLKLRKNYKKKIIKISLIVIRLSKTNKLQSSKPCHHCIQQMHIISQQKGYKLEHIYYSDINSGNLIKNSGNLIKNSGNLIKNSDNLIKTNLKTLKSCNHQHYSKGRFN